MKKNNKTKDKKKKSGNAKKIILVLLIIILILAGIFGYKVYKNGGGLQGLLATTFGHDQETLNKLPKMYCLILGRSQNLTDTIILASYDPKTQEAAMLSIPRDTFVGEDKDYATAWDKINAVYQTGVENLLEDVRELTGIDVRYYVRIDTDSLRELVDEIGGVTFDVPIDMNYDDSKQGLHIHLDAGLQKLDGDKAEQVVRFRHNNNGTTYPESYGVEDIGRMKTQRAFLTTLAKQILVPANVTKIPNFIDIAKKYVETNLDFDSIKDYVPYAVNFNVDNIKTDKLPGIPEVANGIWIYSMYEEESKEVINKLFFEQESNTETENSEGSSEDDETKSDIEKSEIYVEVLNGSGSSANLSEVVSELEAAGYSVEKTGITTTTEKTTVINRRDVSDTVKEDMKRILDTDNMTMGQSSGDINLTIILGTDYVL